jgi:hypothetical protein
VDKLLRKKVHQQLQNWLEQGEAARARQATPQLTNYMAARVNTIILLAVRANMDSARKRSFSNPAKLKTSTQERKTQTPITQHTGATPNTTQVAHPVIPFGRTVVLGSLFNTGMIWAT